MNPNEFREQFYPFQTTFNPHKIFEEQISKFVQLIREHLPIILSLPEFTSRKVNNHFEK